MIDKPLKWHGAKSYLARHLHELTAPYKFRDGRGWLHRVIPCAGSLGEFWDWDCDNVSEVVNDIDGRLTDFYKVLRDDQEFDRFLRLCEATPFSQQLWNEARDFYGQSPHERLRLDMAQRAWYFFILVRQSMAGRMKSFAPLSRRRTRRRANEQASAWWNAVDGLRDAHKRLKRVVILQEDALRVCQREDGPFSLFYLDTPYLASTRTCPRVYDHEMTDEQHEELLRWATKAQGHVVISGYANDLYDSILVGWDRHVVEMANHAASGPVKRRMEEVLWSNLSTR